MALTKNKNSYVTLAEADDYFNDRVNSDIWFADTTTDHTQSLVSAAKLLDQMDWGGTANPTALYPLAWPRDITYYDSVYGDDVELVDDRDDVSLTPGSVPQNIRDAQCELALWLLRNASMAEPDTATTYPLSEIGVGSISLKYDTGNTISDAPKSITEIPATVYNLIKRYLSSDSLRYVRVGG